MAGQVTPAVEGLELGTGEGEGLLFGSEFEDGTVEETGFEEDLGIVRL